MPFDFGKLKLGEKKNHLTFVERLSPVFGVLQCDCGRKIRDLLSKVFASKAGSYTRRTCGDSECPYLKKLRDEGRKKGREASSRYAAQRKKLAELRAKKTKILRSKPEESTVPPPVSKKEVDLTIFNKTKIVIGTKKFHLTLQGTDLTEGYSGRMIPVGVFKCDCGTEVRFPIWRFYAAGGKTRSNSQARTCKGATCYYHLLETKNPAVTGENAVNFEAQTKPEAPEVPALKEKIEKLKRDVQATVAVVPVKEPVVVTRPPRARIVLPVPRVQLDLHEAPLTHSPFKKLAESKVVTADRVNEALQALPPLELRQVEETFGAKERKLPKILSESLVPLFSTMIDSDATPPVNSSRMTIATEAVPETLTPIDAPLPPMFSPDVMIADQLRRLMGGASPVAVLDSVPVSGVTVVTASFDGLTLRASHPVTIARQDDRVVITYQDLRLDLFSLPR